MLENIIIFLFYVWLFGAIFIFITGYLYNKKLNKQYDFYKADHSPSWHIPFAIAWIVMLFFQDGRQTLKEYIENFRSL